MSEKKISKTDLFKQHLQAILTQSLGVKVSKETAWNTFKNVMLGTVEFSLNQEDLKLPLAGIGNFEVIKTEPRGSKAGKDKDGNDVGEAWPFVPRFRFYPSVAVERIVEDHFGLGGHEIEKKHYGIFLPEGEIVAEEVKEEKPKSESKAKTSKKEGKAKEKVEEPVEEVPTEPSLDDEFDI